MKSQKTQSAINNQGKFKTNRHYPQRGAGLTLTQSSKDQNIIRALLKTIVILSCAFLFAVTSKRRKKITA